MTATIVTAGAAALVPSMAQPAGAAPARPAVTIAPTGSIAISARGNGHGHGMSQWGAEGAALKGLSYKQILNFYYPGTQLVTLAPSKIRVLLSATGHALQVRAEPGLTLTNYGALPTTGIAYYHLAASGGTLTLQSRKPGSRQWTTVKTGLPNGSAFNRGDFKTVRVSFTDGTEGRYFGQLRGVVDNGDVDAVNVVRMELYVRGVVPYEIPSSWRQAALSAQAVAARSYGRYAVEHPRGASYDICDNTNCQVYNGYQQFSPSGQLTMQDDPAVVTDNVRQVLQYGGHTIFAEFSASNGGWKSDGGQPYLVAKADPYDAAGGADPWSLQNDSMAVSRLAAYFGLKKATGISITQRDGHGSWGGRVVSGFIQGVDASGRTKVVNFSGYDLQWALGLGTTWINVTAG
ncbi:MAG: SpoIID/LytB domain-containing protein [Jatrophihabitans sp.]|uniref:SpoIID/LytB domain-containing protein n=1 Tax=Jatrophihabitans sp. TaxID=1932789 RepID=UPI003F7CDBB7